MHVDPTLRHGIGPLSDGDGEAIAVGGGLPRRADLVLQSSPLLMYCGVDSSDSRLAVRSIIASLSSSEMVCTVAS